MSNGRQNRIKAVIFDMDGVLIEAKTWHYDALNRALGLFGLEITRQEHLSIYDGLPTLTKLALLSTNAGLPVELHAFINQMKQLYTMELVSVLCKPNFVHLYALSRLKERGYRIAVASNSVRNSVDTMLGKAKLTDYLDFTLSNEDVTEPKPNPEIYDVAIKRMNLEPTECLIVEDNPNGVQAARGSGAHVLVVETVDDVNLANITARIAEIEAAS